MLLLAVVTPLVAVPTNKAGIVWALMANGAATAVSMTPFLPELGDFVTQRGGRMSFLLEMD